MVTRNNADTLSSQNNNAKKGLLEGCLADEDNLDLELEFGRTVIARSKSDQLQQGAVIPLPGNPNGSVQLVWADRTIAEGTLMIYEGKLAIRISEPQEATTLEEQTLTDTTELTVSR